MKHSSKKIKENLLEISFNDPAISTKYKMGNILDLGKYFNNSKTLLNFLWGKEEEIIITDSNISNEIVNEKDSIKTISDFYDFCSTYGITVDQKKVATLKTLESYRSYLETLLKKVTVRVDSIAKKIINNAKTIENNESVYSLYVASYFLSGLLEGDTKPINAPLLLWEVDMKIQDSNIIITKRTDNPTINEKINFYLKQKMKLNLEFEDEVDTKDIMTYVQKLKSLSPLDLNTDRIENFSINETNKLVIKNACVVLNIEPTGGVINEDILRMQKQKAEPFKVNTHTQKRSVYEDSVIKKDELVEINRKLNIYQKYAIESALNEDTLIYGPPGTGKSETIASLVANYINEGSNVLVSSEKQDALEVIQKRLGVLDKIALIGYCKDINTFYGKLEEIESDLRRTINSGKVETYNESYFEIIKVNEFINNFFDQKYFGRKNDKKFTDFINTSTSIDLGLFNELENIKAFDAFDEIKQKQKLSDIEVFKYINDFQEAISNWQEQLEFLLSHSSFDSYDREQLEKFVKNFNGTDDPDLLMSTLIVKNRVVAGKSVFATRKLLVGLDNDAFIELFKIFISFSFNNLSREAIEFMYKINIDKELFQQMHAYKWWINELSNEKILKHPTMDELRLAYVKHRDQLILKNANIILNNYFKDLANKIERMKESEKEKFFTVFSKCKLKKKPAINWFIKTFYDQLRILFPIWMLSPEQVCITCPIQKNIFDYGIFDEASQMFIEKSYPLAFRCKTRVVAGDDKQLQPSNFFAMRSNEEENEDIYIDNSESLFEVASSCLWSKFYLKNHYRSINGELIRFSNEHFYDNELVFSSYNGYNELPIAVHNVKGKWENNSNHQEIDEVLKILKENSSEFATKSIIVVTFNVIQQQLLESAFVNEFSGTKLSTAYKEKRIIFKSLENVQGTEADIVILSVSYAKGDTGSVRQFFGPLSQANGINRLNVAITRARQKMFVVKSITAEDIKLSDNKNHVIFKDYLAYLDNLSAKNKSNKVDKPEPVANLVAYIQNNIASDQQELITNYNAGTKAFDIALFNKKTKMVDFAIIINNNNKEMNAKELMQELDGIQFLSDLGYKIYYLNLIDWLLRREIVEKEIYKKALGM